MTLKDFIKELQSIKSEWQNIEVLIPTKNGMLFEPTIQILEHREHTLPNGKVYDLPPCLVIVPVGGL